MIEIGDTAVRLAGAVLGGAVSLAYLPPKSRREFWARMFVSISAGTISSPVAELHFHDRLPPGWQGLIFAAAACAFATWWILGAVVRATEAYRSRQ